MPNTPHHSAVPNHDARAAAARPRQCPRAEKHAKDRRTRPQAQSQTTSRLVHAEQPDIQPRTTGSVRPRDITSALRALRILEILHAHTDARTGLSSTELVERLANPGEAHLPAINTSRSSVRASITALKTAGFDICASNKTGYALRTHPLADADAELIVGAICESATLSAEQRGRLLDRVLALASPTVRHRLLARSPERPHITATGSSHAVLTFAFHATNDLIRRAVHQGLACSFELADADEPPGQRHRFMPTALFEREGTCFVTGTLVPAARDGSSSQRVFRLDRLRRVAVHRGDDTLLMAPQTLR